jgi:hypothetical protein
VRLADTNYDNSETGCCARVDTAKWEGKTFEWKDKPFLKDHIRSLLHIPINFGTVISRDLEAIENAEAYPEEPITLSEELSPWGSDILVAVDKTVPGVRMETLSGKFLTRVFEGPFRNARKWANEMEDYVKEKGHEVETIYSYYATCPKCAKHFGENRVVLFAKVA